MKMSDILSTHVEKEVVIDTLGPGDAFCDCAFFRKEYMDYSVICNMPVTAYYIDKSDMS